MSASLPTAGGPKSSYEPTQAKYLVVDMASAPRIEAAIAMWEANAIRHRWEERFHVTGIRLWELQQDGTFTEVSWPK